LTKFSALIYTANLLLVMKTGIPCAHILTGKTCFNNRENLLSLQGTCVQNRWFPARPLFYPALYGIAVYKIAKEEVEKYQILINKEAE
jgi:hypothetical protein